MAGRFNCHDEGVFGASIVPAVTAAAGEMRPVPLIATGEAGLAAACLLDQTIPALPIGAPRAA